MLNFLFRRFYRLRLLQSVSLGHLLDDLAGVGQPPLRKQRAVAPVLRLADVLEAEQNQLLVFLLSLGIKPLDDTDNLIDADLIQLLEILSLVLLIAQLQHIVPRSQRVALFADLVPS